MYETYIGMRLAKLRIAKNVSARDMSLSLGQNENYINQVENQKMHPSMQAFFYICEYLNITPKEFFDEEIENPVLIKELVAAASKLNRDDLAQVVSLAKRLGEK